LELEENIKNKFLEFVKPTSFPEIKENELYQNMEFLYNIIWAFILKYNPDILAEIKDNVNKLEAGDTSVIPDLIRRNILYLKSNTILAEIYKWQLGYFKSTLLSSSIPTDFIKDEWIKKAEKEKFEYEEKLDKLSKALKFLPDRRGKKKGLEYFQVFCIYNYFYSICKLSRNYFKNLKGRKANLPETTLSKLYIKYSKLNDNYLIGVITAFKWLVINEDNQHLSQIIHDPPSYSALYLTKEFFGVSRNTVQIRVNYFKKIFQDDLIVMARALEDQLGQFKKNPLPEFSIYNVFQVAEFEKRFLLDLSSKK